MCRDGVVGAGGIGEGRAQQAVKGCPQLCHQPCGWGWARHQPHRASVSFLGISKAFCTPAAEPRVIHVQILVSFRAAEGDCHRAACKGGKRRDKTRRLQMI